MDVRDVQRAVLDGRVVKHPTKYHAGKRGLGFDEVLAGLERCIFVGPDERTDEDGSPLHPYGWFALANLPHRRRLRVDFDLFTDDAGDLLLVVTAYDT